MPVAYLWTLLHVPLGWGIVQTAGLLEDAGRLESPLSFAGYLFAAAGLEELVALYQALPLLPHPELLAPRIAEGIRSNMKPVFNSVALDNPITAERLVQDAWNQTVLKALFIASPVARMVGADRRANPVLAQMLIDYARERIAAKRPVPVDLWDAARPGCNESQRVELNRLQDSAAAVSA